MVDHSHIVTSDEHGKRLDVLMATLPEVVSRSEAVRLVEGGQMRLNGSVVTAKKRIVLEGDRIDYHVGSPQPAGLLGEPMDLDIRYEDDYLIILSKPADLVVHPASGHKSGTLVNALIAHCGYGNLALLQGDDRPGIVHRLDKDTSGLMIVAKSNVAGRVLTDAIRSKSVERRYLTLVHGRIAPQTGLIDAPLARGYFNRLKIYVSDTPSAKSSVTAFEVLERFEAGLHDDGYTLLECRLHTGRTHQIRAHMEYIGHPCVGDPVYGSQSRPKAQLGLTRQFLHSSRLEFTHPMTHEPMVFTDALPDDLAAVLEDLRQR